jgi:hypothetical protein
LRNERDLRAKSCTLRFFPWGAHAPGGLSIGVDVLEDGTIVKRMEVQWCSPARFID